MNICCACLYGNQNERNIIQKESLETQEQHTDNNIHYARIYTLSSVCKYWIASFFNHQCQDITF